MGRNLELKIHMAYSAFRVVLLCSDVRIDTCPAPFAEDTSKYLIMQDAICWLFQTLNEDYLFSRLKSCTLFMVICNFIYSPLEKIGFADKMWPE